LNDTVGAWMELVHELYPLADAMDWDRPGLQIGDPADPVMRVLVTLDVTRAVIDEAAAGDATLVIAHHPLFFSPLVALTPDTATGSIALHAARHRVAVAAAHTNLDAAGDGSSTSEPVVALLGLQGVTPLCAPARPGARPMGRVGDLAEPTTLRALAADIGVRLPAPDVRFVGPAERALRRVAVLGGSGGSAVGDALAAGADVLVTGDVRHHVALDALELGLALIDAGHHATEVAAMPAFASRLEVAARARGLTATVERSGVPTAPWTTP
jgi:dinuclear metal center YbgI/SA1388 family protein